MHVEADVNKELAKAKMSYLHVLTCLCIHNRNMNYHMYECMYTYIHTCIYIYI